jgi:hypothetical protein
MASVRAHLYARNYDQSGALGRIHDRLNSVDGVVISDGEDLNPVVQSPRDDAGCIKGIRRSIVWGWVEVEDYLTPHTLLLGSPMGRSVD